MWATDYLASSSFSILRSRNKPVVALRMEGEYAVECQGRGNESPVEWFADIHLFLQTQGLTLQHRVTEMDAVLANEGDFHQKPAIWWRDRLRLWPFASLMAPDRIRIGLTSDVQSSVLKYVGFPGFEAIAKRIGLSMGRDEWREVICSDPTRYSNCPAQYCETPEVLDACILGWHKLCENGELTLELCRSIPDFVSENHTFQNLMQANLLTLMQHRIRQRPTSRIERENRFSLDEFVPLTPSSPPENASEFMVNWLLSNNDGDFNEDKLPELVRSREDFATIREHAWQEAVKAQPPFLFAVPSDLRRCQGLSPSNSTPARVDLDSWCVKVQQKPWLLTQKSTVPKSIRWHLRIVNAYRDGWLPYLSEFPWRIWVKKGMRRVYMSEALLADETVIDALAIGWCNRKARICDTWMRASERMRNLPAYQLSVLRGMSTFVTRRHRGALDVAQDVADRLVRDQENEASEPLFIDDIRALLSEFESL